MSEALATLIASETSDASEASEAIARWKKVRGELTTDKSVATIFLTARGNPITRRDVARLLLCIRLGWFCPRCGRDREHLTTGRVGDR